VADDDLLGRVARIVVVGEAAGELLGRDVAREIAVIA
jgi:hypothetical protein